jgi:hypothetical protein
MPYHDPSVIHHTLLIHRSIIHRSLIYQSVLHHSTPLIHKLSIVLISIILSFINRLYIIPHSSIIVIYIHFLINNLSIVLYIIDHSLIYQSVIHHTPLIHRTSYIVHIHFLINKLSIVLICYTSIYLLMHYPSFSYLSTGYTSYLTYPSWLYISIKLSIVLIHYTSICLCIIDRSLIYRSVIHHTLIHPFSYQ